MNFRWKAPSVNWAPPQLTRSRASLGHHRGGRKCGGHSVGCVVAVRGISMFCASCGSALGTGDAFCKSCGAKNPSSAMPPPPPSDGTFRPAPPPPTQFASARPPGTNVLSVVSLVGAFIFWPAGIVCGIIARHQIRTSGESGDGMALAGLILSIVFGVLTVLFIVLAVTLFAHFLTCGGISRPLGQNPSGGTWRCVNGVWN